MPTPVILSAVRTPVATARKGSLINTRAEELALTVLEAAMDRAGLEAAQVGDVVFAESLYGGARWRVTRRWKPGLPKWAAWP